MRSILACGIIAIVRSCLIEESLVIAIREWMDIEGRTAIIELASATERSRKRSFSRDHATHDWR